MGLLDRFRKAKTGSPLPFIPPDTRVYAIGDIHGRADLLEKLHLQIQQDASEFRGRKVIVYLGDYIDRGTDSRQVLNQLIQHPLQGFDCVHIRGNHEQTLLDFLEHPQETAPWLNYGGLATLLSYGVRLDRPPYSEDLPVIAERLARKLPESHIEFLRQLSLYHQEGSYLFVHAGIRPGVPLTEQHPEDLMWIREAFIGHRGAHEWIVVHGHTISDEPEVYPNRIGIDTGACVSGVLTCVILEADRQRLLHTGT